MSLEAGRPYGAEHLASAWNDASETTIERLRLRDDRRTNPITYLAFGCMNHNGQLSRGCLKAGGATDLHLMFRRRIDPADAEVLHHALWCWLNLGGIGAKSRNGFGSLQVTSRAGAALAAGPRLDPTSETELHAGLQAILPMRTDETSTAMPEWTRLSPATRVYISDPFTSWSDALERAGAWLIAFRRRYGSPGHTGTMPGNVPLANRDYAWAAPNGQQRRRGFPDRAGFGLPLPFGQGGETVIWGSGRDHRRASPLLLHVAALGTDYYSVWTHLPARLIPDGATLGFKNHTSPTSHVTPEQMSICSRFLEDLASKGLVHEIGRGTP